MGRPFGVGFYGRHRYSRGTFYNAQVKASVIDTAKTSAVPLVGRLGTSSTQVSVAHVSTQAQKNLTAEIAVEVQAQAKLVPVTVRATNKAKAETTASTPIRREARSGLRGQVSTNGSVSSRRTTSSYANLLAELSAIAETDVPVNLVAKAVRAAVTTKVSSRPTRNHHAFLRAEILAKLLLRRTWEDQTAGAPGWSEDLTAQRSWRPQGERPPRKFGAGKYSFGRYSTKPPMLVDRWREA